MDDVLLALRLEVVTHVHTHAYVITTACIACLHYSKLT